MKKLKQEIERKFLVKADWHPQTDGVFIAQGYLSEKKGCTVRIRIKKGRGFLTIKGKTEGISRVEYEYEIPYSEAKELMGLSLYAPVEKTRYVEEYCGHAFEVDVFAGANAPLVMAEIELTSPDEKFASPPWLGDEVSEDPRYYNSYLSENPYSTWNQ